VTVDPGQSITVPFGPESARETVQVTAVEANHCPGAVMFLLEFEAASQAEVRRALYTGDFRWHPGMDADIDRLGQIDLCACDMTYDDPRYRFPPQERAVREVVTIAEENPGVPLVIAVYAIGKNRILRALWERFGEPIHVPESELATYRACGDGDIVTPYRDESRFWAVPRWKAERMAERRGRNAPLVVVPTGWAVDMETTPEGVHYVPYSEHCDAHEREAFLSRLNATKVVGL
jgi:hypothetical protein